MASLIQNGRREEITIEVRTKGIDKAREQIQELSDAMNTPQFTIRNCERCTFNIYPSQTWIVDRDEEEEEREE